MAALNQVQGDRLTVSAPGLELQDKTALNMDYNRHFELVSESQGFVIL